MTTETPLYDACCPVVATLDIIGGKWKVLILYHLNGQTRRFNELQRLMPAITQRMLTLQLRTLEGDGIVTRTVHPSVPPQVEYALTPLGESLSPVFDALMDWDKSRLAARD